MRRRDEYANGEPDREGRGIRQLVTVLAVAFVVTLGVVVGTRMSSDAIAVLVGVIAGVAASIPCALLLMAVTRRRESQEEASYNGAPYSGAPYYGARHQDPRYRQVPPVIVVTPGAAPQQLPYGAPYGFAGPYAGQQPGADIHVGQRRQFRVMGYDEEGDAPVTVEGEVEETSWYR
jgi:hypothetical protein